MGTAIFVRGMVVGEPWALRLFGGRRYQEALYCYQVTVEHLNQARKVQACGDSTATVGALVASLGSLRHAVAILAPGGQSVGSPSQDSVRCVVAAEYALAEATKRMDTAAAHDTLKRAIQLITEGAKGVAETLGVNPPSPHP